MCLRGIVLSNAGIFKHKMNEGFLCELTAGLVLLMARKH